MIETSNPEIDVNKLMERVRAEAPKIHLPSPDGASPRRQRIRQPLPPSVAELAPPPALALSRPMDSKLSRAEARLQKARGMIEVSRSIPKMLHGLFRRQGGFNRAAIETMNELAKANVQLNKRVRELTLAAEQQNQWMRALSIQRQSENAWMRTVAQGLAEAEQKVAQLEGTNGSATEQANQLRRQMDQLARDTGILRGNEERAGEHLRNLQHEVEQQKDLSQSLRDCLDRSGEHLRNLQTKVDGDAATVEAVREQLERHGEHLRNLEARSQFLDVRPSLSRLEERQINEAVYLKGELSRHSAILESFRFNTGPKGKTEAQLNSPTSAGDPHRLDSFYLSFENRFRGTRAEITERIRFYLPYLKEARAGSADRPILDVGCGRGEWLELMREERLEASGVDLNSAMVAQCRARNLEVTQGDAIAFLRGLPDESQGTVTGFHIIEHLPLETLLDLIAESRRVLQPGGLAIFESPNCKNLVVGACNFNIDPTHRNPVFPETAEFILQTQGFEKIELQYLSPVDATHLSELPNESSSLHQLLYGPQDFAVIGRKPAMA